MKEERIKRKYLSVLGTLQDSGETFPIIILFLASCDPVVSKLNYFFILSCLMDDLTTES